MGRKDPELREPYSEAPPAYTDPSWALYRGRWRNWQRGSLLGMVAKLESRPEAFLGLLSILLLPHRGIANVTGRFGEIVGIWRS